MRHDVAETVELTYTTRPPMPGDIAFVHRMNEIVKEEASVRARKSPLAPFDFDIEGLYRVDVRPAEGEGLLVDVTRTRLNVRPSANGSSKEPRQELFSARIVYPDDRFKGRLDSLVGVDGIVAGAKSAALIMTTDRADQWARRFHPAMAQAIARRRDETYPAMLLTGDPGLGKTEIAMALPDWLARTTGEEVHGLKLDLQVRSGGHVGDLSKHISEAWTEVESLHSTTHKPVVLWIDEADGLTESRAQVQQHHEDRVGVTTIIQRMDKNRGTRIMVILMTNLDNHIDPAVRRRIPFQYHLTRPDLDARRQLLDSLFWHGVPAKVLDEIGRRTQGYTPADLNRLFWHVVTSAIASDRRISEDSLFAALAVTKPTATFEEERERSAGRR